MSTNLRYPRYLLALLVAVVIVPAGCGLVGDDTSSVSLICSDPASADNLDQDGDGFSPCDGDCDDDDAAASPAGVEESQTDGYDQDCDNFDPVRE